MHNYSRVLRNQTVSEKVTLQHLPTLITWETLSHYTDIPPSSRLCLVNRKKQIRKTHSIAVLEKGKEKISNRLFFSFSSDAFGSAATGRRGCYSVLLPRQQVPEALSNEHAQPRGKAF